MTALILTGLGYPRMDLDLGKIGDIAGIKLLDGLQKRKPIFADTEIFRVDENLVKKLIKDIKKGLGVQACRQGEVPFCFCAVDRGPVLLESSHQVTLQRLREHRGVGRLQQRFFVAFQYVRGALDDLRRSQKIILAFRARKNEYLPLSVTFFTFNLLSNFC